MASIEQRASSSGPSWRVIWREDGERKRVTFDNAEKAVRFRQLVEGSGNRMPDGWRDKVAAGPVSAADVLTFAQWAETAIGRRTRASERTKADYRRDLTAHFAAIATVPLADLDAGHVVAWLDDRQAAGLAAKTIRNLHGFASSLLVDALAQHPPLVSHNPFARKLSDLAAVRTEEMVFLTPPEFALVLARVRDEYRDLVRLLAGTGLRFGEATALTVGDVDLLGKRKTLTVTKAWKRTGPAQYVVGEPKTRRSRRTISLSAELVDMLLTHVAGKRSGELLFCGPAGLRIPHTELYKRGWAPAVARANVCDACYVKQKDGRGNPPRLPESCEHVTLGKTPRIHDLRHSHASWLIAEGVPLAAISRRLGHSSIQITVDRYGHLDPALDDTVNAAVDRALASR